MKNAEWIKTIDNDIQNLTNEKNTIDNKLLLKMVGIPISIIIPLGFSTIFNLLQDWLISSFIVMLFWFILGMKNIKRSKKESEKNLRAIKKMKSEKLYYGADILIENISFFLKSVAVIFFLNIIVILLISFEKPVFNFTYLVPLIASIFFISLPFTASQIKVFLSPENIKLIEKTRKNITKHKAFKENYTMFSNAIFFAIYIIFFGAFIVWSLLIVFALFDNIINLVLILFLQIFLFFIIANYFSGEAVKKEIGRSILNLRNLKNDMISNKQIRDAKKKYISTKRFNWVPDDSFKLIGFYMFIPNPKFVVLLEKGQIKYPP